MVARGCQREAAAVERGEGPDDEAEEEIDLSTLKNALEEDSDSDEEMT